MFIRILQALDLETKFQNSASYFAVPGLNRTELLRPKSAHMDVVLLNNGKLEYIAPVADFRLLTSLITVVLLANAFYRDKDPEGVDTLRELLVGRKIYPYSSSMLVDPDLHGLTAFSLESREYKSCEDLFDVASEANSKDVYYLAGLAVGDIRYNHCYPRGSSGAIGQMAELKNCFEWEEPFESYPITSWAGNLILQFDTALKTMKGLGFEFQFEEECKYILSKINSGAVLMKLDPSEPFSYPIIT